MVQGQQIAIVGIENGCIVQSQSKIQSVQQNQQPIPTSHFCESFEDLVAYLRDIIVVDGN